MAVIRIEKTRDYTVMANYHLRDKRLSYKAKGIMSFMLSLPDGWDYTVNGLSAFATDGRDGVREALRELEAAGYLRMGQSRASGKFGKTDYVITEKPFTAKPITENPLTEKPSTAKPLTENPTLLSTKLLSTNKSNTKEVSTKRESTKGKRAAKRHPDLIESMPDGVLKDSLRGFIESRKTLKAPLTGRAMDLIIAKLQKMAPGNESMQAAIIDQSVERGWKGVFPLKDEHQYNRQQQQTTGSRAMDEAAAAIAMLEEQEQSNEQ